MRRKAWMVLFGFVSGVWLSGRPVEAQTPQPRRPSTAAASPVRGPANAKVPDPAAEAAKRREMDSLLGLWEKQSARLTSLDVAFRRVDKSPGWDVREEFTGQAVLQSPNLACLHFRKLVTPDAKAGQKTAAATYVDHERIVCTGKEILQYDYATKEIFRFPLDRQARKKPLEEGPLPFLFNMKAEEAKARYTMTLMDQNRDAYVIAVLPLLDPDREVFSSAFIQLNKKTFLPDRIMLVSPNEKDTQDYVFSKVTPNKDPDPKFFQGAVSIAGWKLIDNPTRGASRTQPGEPPRGETSRGQVGQRPGAVPRRNQ